MQKIVVLVGLWGLIICGCATMSNVHKSEEYGYTLENYKKIPNCCLLTIDAFEANRLRNDMGRLNDMAENMVYLTAQVPEMRPTTRKVSESTNLTNAKNRYVMDIQNALSSNSNINNFIIIKYDMPIKGIEGKISADAMVGLFSGMENATRVTDQQSEYLLDMIINAKVDKVFVDDNPFVAAQ